MKDYSETLIQQIDTMNAVASAFSNFASMPAQQNDAERSGSGRTRNRYFQ
jgi:nitrogen fixation/metabolism regulation signal transduction histidine kinase